MSKLIVIPNNKNTINELSTKCDGFILGVNEYSVNMPINFSLDEINDIVNQLTVNNKKVFIALNKNIHNNELENLKDILLYLNNLNISGILYYDIAVVNLVKKLNIKIPLIWSQEHLTTNYATCNFWNDNGVQGVYLSNDITLDEIINIKKQTKMNLFVCLFGYLPMFASYRHLVNNYLNTFDLQSKNSKQYIISKENNDYTIIDNSLGTFVYSANILNGIDEYIKLKDSDIDYIILNSFNIDSNDFTKIVNLFTSVNENNVNDYSKKIYEIFPNCDKGFLYKETVYKVKNNE